MHFSPPNSPFWPVKCATMPDKVIIMLNDDKTEFVILSTKQQLTKVNINNIKVGPANVSPVPVVRNLG